MVNRSFLPLAGIADPDRRYVTSPTQRGRESRVERLMALNVSASPHPTTVKHLSARKREFVGGRPHLPRGQGVDALSPLPIAGWRDRGMASHSPRCQLWGRPQ
jgi:hypothetical protein